MAIWAIADIHASATDPRNKQPAKPMDQFGPAWENHVQRLERAWQERIQPSDTVIVAGDIDWALHLEGARETLERIDGWTGQKILLRGNHDYWWSSKTTSKVRRALPPSLSLLHNNSFQVEGFNICGAKGSPVPGAIDWTDEKEKILRREEGRLRMSLDARDPELPTIVALHFPPFYRSNQGTGYGDILHKYQVVACVYGHLHGEAAGMGPEGQRESTHYFLVAGDATGFQPVLIENEGKIE